MIEQHTASKAPEMKYIAVLPEDRLGTAALGGRWGEAFKGPSRCIDYSTAQAFTAGSNSHSNRLACWHRVRLN
jgi:hypothetical protein